MTMNNILTSGGHKLTDRQTELNLQDPPAEPGVQLKCYKMFKANNKDTKTIVVYVVFLTIKVFVVFLLTLAGF